MKTNFVKLHREAVAAGHVAGSQTAPTPMNVIQRANPLDDHSPVTRSWHVPEGPCGFAWVNIKAKGAGLRFINALKKAGLAGNSIGNEWKKDSYYGGFTYWVRSGGQSIERKQAFAEAMVSVLRDAGITAYAMSRLD